jgi:hypothetical protein
VFRHGPHPVDSWHRASADWRLAFWLLKKRGFDLTRLAPSNIPCNSGVCAVFLLAAAFLAVYRALRVAMASSDHTSEVFIAVSAASAPALAKAHRVSMGLGLD